MSRSVRRHPDFEADFVAQLDWIVAHGDAGWIDLLEHGTVEVVRMLAELPGVGVLLTESGSVQLRKVIFRKGPYVAWYVHDAAVAHGDVWLLRLFHARQRRPTPNLRWWKKRA